MTKNDAKDGVLFERCIRLIDQVFPGAKEMIAQGKVLGADWQAASIPFVIEKNGQPIAHLGIVPITLTISQQTMRVAALHGICVKESHRGQGYFKQLMQEALTYVKTHFDASLLFTDSCALYQPFGYQRRSQFDFLVAKPTGNSSQTEKLRRLYLQDPTDLALFDRLFQHRITFANMGHLQHRTLYLLNSLDMKLYYAENSDAIIVYKAHKKLYVQDVICTQPTPLQILLATIPEKYPEVILQFHPGESCDFDYQAIPAKTIGDVMVCERFILPSIPFRWSEMARC